MQNTENSTQGMGKGMIILSLILGLVLLYFLFEDKLEEQYNPNQQVQSSLQNTHIEIKLQRNRMGHYVASGSVNGKDAVFLLDTGATYVAIPSRFSNSYGLKKGPTVYISTANGQSKGYQTRIDKLKIGKITLYDVKAIITPNLEEILLGMSALKQLEFTQRGAHLTIRQYL